MDGRRLARCEPHLPDPHTVVLEDDLGTDRAEYAFVGHGATPWILPRTSCPRRSICSRASLGLTPGTCTRRFNASAPARCSTSSSWPATARAVGRNPRARRFPSAASRRSTSSRGTRRPDRRARSLRRFADPRASNQDARAGAAGGAVRVDELAAAFRCRQRVEHHARAERGGAPHRGEPHRRAHDRDRVLRARGDRGVTGEAAGRGAVEHPGELGERVAEARGEAVHRHVHDVEVVLQRARRDADADASREARREPRDLLGDERGRAQREEQRARRRPPAPSSPRGTSPPPAAGSAGSRRTRRGARSSSRRRTRARHASAAWARSSSTISAAGQVEVRVEPQRHRPGRERRHVQMARAVRAVALGRQHALARAST